MRVTYLIGNGFDIALGLKTRYSDFIEYYCKKNKSCQPILVRLQQEMQKADPECQKLWSCAEMAFAKLDWGSFSNGTRDDTISAFRQCLTDFQNELDVYLRSQSERVVVPIDTAASLAEKLFSRMLSIDQYLSHGHAVDFRRMLESGNIELNFVVFNYTDVLEQLWNACPARSSDGQKCIGYVHNNARREIVVGRPCFVHGSFLSPPFLFGVDDLRQILNDDIRGECERFGYLIKPFMDEDAALGFAQRAKDTIAASDIVVTYGLSFGESDKSWWRLLYDHVFRNGRMFVCCPYYPKSRPVSNSGDAYVDNVRTVLTKVFGSLNDARNYPMDFRRQSIRSVKVLRDIETEYDGERIRCDYLDLAMIGKGIVMSASKNDQVVGQE